MLYKLHELFCTVGSPEDTASSDEDKQNPSTSEDHIEADHTEPDEQGLSSVQQLDSKIREDLEHQLRENLRKIRNQYTSYVQYILISLKEKKVDVEDLRSFILNLPAFIDTSSRQTMLWSGKSVDFEEANSINDIFKILVRDCCSFLDCNTFEQIMAQYEVDSSNDKIVQYYEDLKEYIEKHKASEFALINPSLDNLASTSTEMRLKFDVDELKCRLGDIKELKRAVARILGLRPSTLTILDIQEGCIILTLLIPTSVAEVLFNSDTSFSVEQVKQFQHISTMWLQCGGYIFNFKKEIESEISLQGKLEFHSTMFLPHFSALHKMPTDRSIDFIISICRIR